jgi:5-methylcytosine-specific restriction endonuclease McrA
VRRVFRKDCQCPPTWAAKVAAAFPEYAKFLRKAAQFERLDVNCPARRGGFAGFAPETLPNKRGKREFPPIWGKEKERIAAMSHRKCVYCEGPINAPRAAHVEHFRPKSLFPSSAYEWTNYFLGCPGCNGAKSDRWPERGGYPRPAEAIRPGTSFSPRTGTCRRLCPGAPRNECWSIST